ncbi:hypothetical protein LCGC14_1074740 [marine sediment metagenome]|uniref:Uncharacterized protein n=1 Tax=marine sediment metagenome TaxID=412755 RepID=A0A0F9N4D7_9ZZZZ
MSVLEARLLRGEVTQSSAADDDTATATVAAVDGVTHLVFGVEAHYDAAVTAIRDITIKHTSTNWQVIRWDFSNGAFITRFPVAFSGDPDEAVSATLEASGNGGDSGYVAIFTATN